MARAKPPSSGAKQARLKDASLSRDLVVATPVVKPPVEYDPELVQRICDLIAGGGLLDDICALDGMPTRQAFRLWRKRYPEVAQAYQEAKEAQIEAYVEETIRIADSTPPVADHVARNKLMIATRQWYAEKLVPKVYGNKVGIGGADDLPPIKTEHAVDVDLTLTPAEAYRRMCGG